MIIYTNGCSHTHDYLEYKTWSYVDIVTDYLTNGKYENVYLNDGFFNKHKKNIDYISNGDNYLIKHSLYGKSNDLILFETINVIHQLINDGCNVDYSVIQLTGPNRRFHYDIDGNFININPHDYSNMGIKLEPFASEQTIQYILILQNLFEKYKIQYCFVPYMEIDSDVYNKSINKNFINLDKFTTDITIGHRNEFRKKGLSRDVNGHPNSFGFYELSKMVLKCLSKDAESILPFDYYFNESDTIHSKLGIQKLIKKYADKLDDGTDGDIENVKDLI